MQDELLEKLGNLLTLEHGIYNTLRAMVSRELEAIVLDGDMEELLLILEEKQEVISRLQLLADSWLDALPELGLDTARGNEGFWEKLKDCFTTEGALQLEESLKTTREAAEDLMEAEKSVQSELEKHVSLLRQKMLQMNQGRSAFIGYAKMGGGYIDPDEQ